MTHAWIYLLLAGLCEIAWAAGLKKFGFTWTLGGAATVAGMLLSFLLLERALRTLPLGTAYAIWTGIGAVGGAIVGMALFAEPRDWRRLACIGAIVVGIAGLKLLTPTHP